jgi:L-xylulose reductase
VNVRSVLVVTQVCAKSMIDSGAGGSVVNISSQASMVALHDHTAYCMFPLSRLSLRRIVFGYCTLSVYTMLL